MQIANERRGQPRASLDTSVIAFIGDERIECRAVDISATGMALLCPVVRPNGQFMRINFALPSRGAAQWLDADGVVARVTRVEQGVLLGVQFLVIEDRAAQEVHAYVEFTRDANARAQQQEVYLRRVAGSTDGGRASAAAPQRAPIASVEDARMPDASHPPRVTGEFVPGDQRRTGEYGRIDDGIAASPGIGRESSSSSTDTAPWPVTPSGITPQSLVPTGSTPRAFTPTDLPLRAPPTTGGTPRAFTPVDIPVRAPPTTGSTPRAFSPADIPRRAPSSTGSTPRASSPSGSTPRAPSSTGIAASPEAPRRDSSPGMRAASDAERWPVSHEPQPSDSGRWPGESSGSAGSSSHSTGRGRVAGDDAGHPRGDTAERARARDANEPRRSTRPPAAPEPARRTSPPIGSEPPAAGSNISRNDLAALYRDALNEVDGKKGKKRK
jgi:PilZ domain